MIGVMVTALLALAQVGEPASLVGRWRESLALDRPREVLSEGAPLVAAGGVLHADGEALALVARALFEARDDGLEAATKLLEAAEPSPASAVFVELERARLLLESDQLGRALIALLPEPEAREPRFAERPEGWLYAGRAWARSGKLARAAPFLARFVELAPRDREAPAALHLLAQEALERNDGAAAQALVRRAEDLGAWHALWRARVIQIREHPEEPLPRLGLGQLWLQAGDGARAKRVLSELCALAPQLVGAWFLLGEAERELGDLEAARGAYDRALERDPEHVLALNNRGTIHRLAGRLAEARADFERIVDGPHASERLALPAHLSLARLLDATGDAAGAARRHARYVELGGTEPLRPPPGR